MSGRRKVIALVAVTGCLGCGITLWTWRGQLSVDTGSPTPRESSNELASSAEPVPTGPIRFTEIQNSGVDFIHATGTNPERPFPAANGSGIAALDADLDGRIDLYFATGTPFPIHSTDQTPRNQMYRNLGGWKFDNITAQSGLGHDGYSVGLAVGDCNSDGFPDVYVNCYGPNVLYCNNGDGTFSRTEAGVDDARWGNSAAFFDLDNDGLLDLYVCNYARWTWENNTFCGDQVRKVRRYCSPELFPAEEDVCYRNLGDGRFADVTADAGFKAPSARAQGVVAADINDDGLIDLYVANDLHPNTLFLNAGGGKFTNISERSGTAYDALGRTHAGMGTDCADLDGDGLPELFVTNFEKEYNTCYHNLGGGFFLEDSQPRGLATGSLPWVGWGISLTDFDLDGWRDVLVTNGHVDDNLHLLGRDAPWEEPVLLWRNSSGRFKLEPGEAIGDYFTRNHPGRALVLADLDDDLDADVVIGHQDQAPALLRNDRISKPTDKPASLSLRLIGTRSNRDAVGATIKWTVEGRSFVEQVKGGGSYLSAHDLRPILTAQSDPDVVEIRWPSGLVQRLSNLKTGGRYSVVEGLAPVSSP